MSGKIKKFVFNTLTVEFHGDNIENIVIDSLNSSPNEIGGVITGCYFCDNKKAIIKSFHGPTIDSVGTPYNYVRGKKGLSALMQKLWKKNEYYLVEWHLHPFSLPTASNTDLTQILEISKMTQYRCPEPILIIIGGDIKNLSYNVYLVINQVVEKMEEIE